MRNKIIVYVVLAAMFAALSFAEFMDVASLGIGLLVAVYALGLNAPVASLMLVVSGLLNFSFPSLVYNLGAGLSFSLLWLVNRKIKTPSFCTILTLVAAQSGIVIMGFIGNVNVVAIIVNVFLSSVFSYLAYCFGVPVIKNGMRYKLLDSELIAGGIILIALSYGLSCIELRFPFLAALFAISVLSSAKIFGGKSLWVGLCFALGYCIRFGVDLFGAFALMSLTALIFIPAMRILSVFSIIMSFVMYTFFFNVVPSDVGLWFAALLCGGIAYMLIPLKRFDKAKEFFAPDGRKVLRSMINRNRVATGVKLESVSDVFARMSVTLKEEKISKDDDAQKLTQELVGRECTMCKKYERCAASGVIASVSQVMDSALASGRPIVADLPEAIKTNCVSIAKLISSSAQIAEEYNAKRSRRNSANEAKSVIATQLGGVADMLNALAKKQSQPLRFDESIEKRIVEELTYRSVVTSEALVTNAGDEVMLCVLNKTLDKEIIKSTLKKMLGSPYAIEKSESSELSGWTVVYATKKPKFDVVFSVSGCAKDKNGVSGDTHSFVKIDSHRFMMAICDGMGSGEKANEFSSSTVSLIENFYKADFNHNLVLSSVNEFLSLSSDEIYSAADVVVVDLQTGMCDLIKIGSPASYIKTDDSVLRVEGASLPIGLLEEMKPSVTTYPLSGGETVVITSDGAADGYCGDELADVINNFSRLPSELCKRVVKGALKSNEPPSDDITVAAFHIFESI